MQEVMVVLEDGPLLVCNKPAGLLTEAPAGIDSMVVRVKTFLRERDQKPGNVYLGVPHRLDRAVTGVILFAKNSKAARRLAEQFHDRRIQKNYWAIVAGRPETAEGTLVDWLEKAKDRPQARIVEKPGPAARECILHYRTLASVDGRALLEIRLETGRFHQIRAQLSHHGWPVVGDRAYGSQLALEGAFGVDATAEERPIALHAREMTLFHPVRYDSLNVRAPLPPHWPHWTFDEASVGGGTSP